MLALRLMLHEWSKNSEELDLDLFDGLMKNTVSDSAAAGDLSGNKLVKPVCKGDVASTTIPDETSLKGVSTSLPEDRVASAFHSAHQHSNLVPLKFATALCSSLGSLEQIVNCKKPLEISVTVYTSKPQYYRTKIKGQSINFGTEDSDIYI